MKKLTFVFMIMVTIVMATVKPAQAYSPAYSSSNTSTISDCSECTMIIYGNGVYGKIDLNVKEFRHIEDYKDPECVRYLTFINGVKNDVADKWFGGEITSTDAFYVTYYCDGMLSEVRMYSLPELWKELVKVNEFDI